MKAIHYLFHTFDNVAKYPTQYVYVMNAGPKTIFLPPFIKECAMHQKSIMRTYEVLTPKRHALHRQRLADGHVTVIMST